LPLSTQFLCDAACINWEIHREHKAKIFEEKISKTSRVPSLSLSKYLGTLISAFRWKSRKIHLRVNRTRPEHEGENELVSGCKRKSKRKKMRKKKKMQNKKQPGERKSEQ